MKVGRLMAVSVFAVSLAGFLCGGCSSSQAKLQAQAKISKADAERIALSKVPGGAIKEGELEKENGRLIYSFDIARAGSKDITEVHVDAVTGAVVGVENESAEQEKAEKAKK